MCGIAGYIGESKKPKLTYELITSLFDVLESRGIDASGVWGTEIGTRGRVVYHKEPVKSSEFVQGNFWSNLKKVKTDMLLVHSRATSRGGGNASTNANNHPFVSKDRRLGLVHNGTLEEANYLKNKYQTLSDTDSECLLRIFEHGMDKEFERLDGVPDSIASRVTGIKDIWSYICQGAMAVALGERIDDHSRGLFLFRNDKRPLWLADLRSTLGQIFFFSSPEIWYGALHANSELEDACSGTEKIMELPAHQIWYMSIDKESRNVKQHNVFKFALETKHTGQQFIQGEFKRVKGGQVELDVLTDLDDDDELAVEDTEVEDLEDQDSSDVSLWSSEASDSDAWKNLTMKIEHEELCAKISKLADNINTQANNLCMEGSMDEHDYVQLISYLEQTICDLRGTLQMLR